MNPVIIVLILIAGGHLSLGEESSPEPRVAVHNILNKTSDMVIYWSLTDYKYEDWFYYYDNFTTNGTFEQSEFAQNLFPNHTVDVEQFFRDDEIWVDGTWVAYFNELGSPLHRYPLPLINFTAQNVRNYDKISIRYFIYGAPIIRIYVNGEEESSFNVIGCEEECKGWQLAEYTRPSMNQITFELDTEEEDSKLGDFIFIEYILIQKFEDVTTTVITSTTITEEPVKETTTKSANPVETTTTSEEITTSSFISTSTTDTSSSHLLRKSDTLILLAATFYFFKSICYSIL